MQARTLKYSVYLLIVSNVLLYALSTLWGCAKVSTANTLNDSQLLSDYTTSQIEVNSLIDMLSAVGGIGTDKPSDQSFLPTCSAVTFDTLATLSQPIKTITLDFTNANCLNSKLDNQYRRGQLYLTWQGRLRDIGNVFSITATNYYVNNDRHGINISVTSHGQDGTGYYFFTYTATDTIDYAITKKRATLQYTTTKRFVSGYYTVSPTDNVYLLTGTYSGTGSQHISYNVSVDTAYLFDNTCYYRFLAGSATVTPSGYSDRHLVFRNGNKCTNNAALLIDGGYKNIFIR